MDDLIYRLRKRAEIRRQIKTRKSVQEGAPDRISDLLEEAANEISLLRAVGPSMLRGTSTDGSEWWGTMLDVLNDYKDAADCEAAEVDRINKSIDEFYKAISYIMSKYHK